MERILAIIKKEILLDLKQKHLVMALLLYVVCNCFIAYKAFNVLPKVTWNATVLLIFLFVGLNTILKSFSSRYKNRQLFYYSYYNPVELLIATLIYNFSLLFLLSIAIVGTLGLFASIEIQNLWLYLSSMALGSLGVSILFSFISLLSIKSNSNTTIFSILALPLALPFMFLMLKINAVALGLIFDSTVMNDIYIFIGLILMFFSLSLISFPTLWKS